MHDDTPIQSLLRNHVLQIFYMLLQIFSFPSLTAMKPLQECLFSIKSNIAIVKIFILHYDLKYLETTSQIYTSISPLSERTEVNISKNTFFLVNQEYSNCKTKQKIQIYKSVFHRWSLNLDNTLAFRNYP